MKALTDFTKDKDLYTYFEGEVLKVEKLPDSYPPEFKALLTAAQSDPAFLAPVLMAYDSGFANGQLSPGARRQELQYVCMFVLYCA